MSVTILSYQDYFRKLAIAHKDIQHNPAGEKRFARWSTDEIVTGLRTAVSFPALLLENYEVITKENNKYDIKGTHSGAFTILEHAQPGDYASEAAAFDKSERILYEVLQQIWQDHYGTDKDRCGTPFQHFFFDLNIISVGPLFNNEFGWRVEFTFMPRLQVKLTEAPAPGTFNF